MIRALALLAPVLVAGCIGSAPLQLADDHPAHPKASPGLVGTSTTLEGYKSAADFAATAAQEPVAASGAGAHAGMQHGGHSGMQHGSAATARPATRQ